GFAGATPLGLLLGQIAQSGAGAYRLARSTLASVRQEQHKIHISGLIQRFREYSRYPKYSTWEALANSGAIQFPIIVIAGMTAGAETGFIMLAMRLLAAPMGLIGGAVSQVYLAEAAVKYQSGELESFTRKIIVQLAKTGVIPVFLAAFTVSLFVPLVFGEGWGRAGALISWMASWFLM